MYSLWRKIHTVLIAALNSTRENNRIPCANNDIQIVQNNNVQSDMYIEGRVELCLNGVWGTVCKDSHFDSIDAGVLCNQLGGYVRETAKIVSGSVGVGPIFVDRLDCSMEDQTLSDCQLSSPLGVVNRLCDHSMDVSLRCYGIGIYIVYVLTYIRFFSQISMSVAMTL